MKKIGLLSDTHGYLDESILKHLRDCDEIWHAGDIGDAKISDTLSKLKPYRAVFGNIDGTELRTMHPLDQVFKCEDLNVFITHIGGYPGNYFPEARKKISALKPDLFICGHSHILKIISDKANNLLHINPGAAGKHGFHKFRTMITFKVNGKKIEEVKVVELGLRGSID